MCCVYDAPCMGTGFWGSGVLLDTTRYMYEMLPIRLPNGRCPDGVLTSIGVFPEDTVELIPCEFHDTWCCTVTRRRLTTRYVLESRQAWKSSLDDAQRSYHVGRIPLSPETCFGAVIRRHGNLPTGSCWSPDRHGRGSQMTVSMWDCAVS